MGHMTISARHSALLREGRRLAPLYPSLLVSNPAGRDWPGKRATGLVLVAESGFAGLPNLTPVTDSARHGVGNFGLLGLFFLEGAGSIESGDREIGITRSL